MDQGSKSVSSIPRLSSRLPVPQRLLRGSAISDGKSATSQEVARSIQPQAISQNQRSAAGITARTRPTSLRTAPAGPTSCPEVASAPEHISGTATPNVGACELADDTSQQGGLVSSNDRAAIEPASDLNIDQGCGSNGVLSGVVFFQPETPRGKRKPRPSLSDRTIETLSQIPPSPKSTRRRSSFFNRDTPSPMRPPLRPASAMSSSRSRPSSPSKPPPVPALPPSFAAKSNAHSMPGRRSMTQPAKPTAIAPDFKPPNYSKTTRVVGTRSLNDYGSSKSVAATRQRNSSQAEPSTSCSLAKKPLAKRQPVAAKSAHITNDCRKASSVSTSTTVFSNSYRSGRSSIQSSKSCSTDADANVDEPPKQVSKSSTALRDAIARAKNEAARKKSPVDCMRQKPAPVLDAQSGFESAGVSIGSNTGAGLLRKRINAALLSGHLNMAAMGLNSIPTEIRHMYDFSEETGANWSECVDLTKFIAADNELDKLEDDLFPDMTNAELQDADDAEYSGQFRGLEILDLHSNMLMELPLGIRRLQHLRTLNLSGNKLGVQSLNIICQIGENLTELRIADNELSGLLSEKIKDLQNLQVLDLHANKITELPGCLRELAQLKILNLAQNNLSSFPSELLVNSTLVELLLSGNRLPGTFFPPEIQSMALLKQLDVSHNALEELACSDIALPNLQTVNLSGNRLKALPGISSWTQLLTFAVAGNLMAEIPPGLASLSKLRNADLSNNNIARLDEGIASMESLVSMNLTGNPLRERKFLSISTDDLKARLQQRAVATEAPLEKDMVVPNSTPGPAGLLDLSSQALANSNLPALNPERPIFDLRLHHNALTTIPISILSHQSISETLKSLDLSHNPLQPAYFPSLISLPNLKSLSLTSCHLTSLDALTTHLTAPTLTTLNLSTNHLSGPFPNLHLHFPALTTLLAADNRFSTLNVDAVRGLSTLDVRNNEIALLEPRLGLLHGLKCMEVQGNKFRVPRWDVVDKGTEAVLRWLRGRVPVEELEGWEGNEE